jgi:hypothetical protein
LVNMSKAHLHRRVSFFVDYKLVDKMKMEDWIN